jgi:CII-binding regulator of phage lambda lysogenization HflD
MDSSAHVISRIERLEDAERQLSEHLQRLAVQTERVAVATEVLSAAMTRQYQQNTVISTLTTRVTVLENSMGLLKKIGGAIVTVGVGIIMYRLFGVS